MSTSEVNEAFDMSELDKDSIRDDLEAVSVHSETCSEARGSEDGLDFDNRDPNALNDHVQTEYDDVIGEPDGAHSGDCVWKNSFRCFNIGKGCCYRLLTMICAIPLAFCWGCEFACITFSHIWLITPCFRIFDINFDCFRKFWATCIHCLYDPCCEASSLMFSRIGMRYRETGEGVDTPTGSMKSKRFKRDFFGKKSWD